MKSAKHTKYEGNPRHAKGLQILSDREYKRLAKRAASMALAAAMAASTLCAPALAIEYDVVNGTVHTDVNDNQEVISWQDLVNEIFNHTITGDNTIDIVDKSSTGTNDQVLNVGSGTTDLDITVDKVTATTTGESAIKVEDNTEVNITVTDSSLSSTGAAAVDVSGKTDMAIVGSTIRGGDDDEAAIEVRGESNVALVGSEVYGNGTGVHVEPNATLIIGGAEVQVGDLYYSPVPQEVPEEEEQVSREISDTSVIVGNSVTVEEVSEEPVDVSGTAIAAEDNASVIVNEDAAALVVGSDVTVNVAANEDAGKQVTLQGESTGIELEGNASLTVEGNMEVYGERVYMTGDNKANVSIGGNNVAVEAAGSSSVNVSESGNIYARDVEVQNNSSYYTVYNYKKATGTNLSSRYVEFNGEYYLVKGYYIDRNGGKRYTTTKSSAKFYEITVDGKTIEFDLSNEEYQNMPLYSRSSASKKATATNDSTGAGVLMQDDSSMINAGYTVAQSLTLEDNALLKVVDEGSVGIDTLTLAQGYTNPIELGGLLYLRNLSKDGTLITDADLMDHFKNGTTFDAVGTGARFAAYLGGSKDWLGNIAGGVTNVYYQIGEEDDSEEITVDLASMMYDTAALRQQLGEGYVLPGDGTNYKLLFGNKSGHEYAYLDNSFEISPDVGEDLSYLPARCPSPAIVDLYRQIRNNPSLKAGKLTFEDLVCVEENLREIGYDFDDSEGKQKFDSLADFYLAYLNHTYGKKNGELCSSLDEAVKKYPYSYLHTVDSVTFTDWEWGTSSDGSNGQLFVKAGEDIDAIIAKFEAKIAESGCTAKLFVYPNPDGGYYLQLKENPEVGLGRYYYEEYMALKFGEHFESSIANDVSGFQNNQGREYTTIGDFNNPDQDPETGAYALNEKVFQTLGTKENPFGEGEKELLAYYFMDGPRNGNSFQLFSYGWNNTFKLVRIDPDPVPPTTDPEEPTPDPDPEEPTLILTPVPEEEEVPEEETPLAPAPVEEIPEEETPLVDAPVIDESLEEIGEEDVPLASAPKTGDESGAFGLMAVLSGMALGVMSFFGKKKEQ